MIEKAIARLVADSLKIDVAVADFVHLDEVTRLGVAVEVIILSRVSPAAQRVTISMILTGGEASSKLGAAPAGLDRGRGRECQRTWSLASMFSHAG